MTSRQAKATETLSQANSTKQKKQARREDGSSEITDRKPQSWDSNQARWVLCLTLGLSPSQMDWWALLP